jgi:hypothetical protein
MLILAMFAVATRFAIRFRLYQRRQQQQRFSIEDGFLVFGLACATAGVALLLHTVDMLYVYRAARRGPTEAEYARGIRRCCRQNPALAC